MAAHLVSLCPTFAGRLGYTRYLWHKVQGMSAEHMGRSWSSHCKWMATLALCELHLPDLHTVRDGIFGMGDVACLVLTEAGDLDLRPPPTGMYASATAAMLTALLDHVEKEERRRAALGSRETTSVLCRERELLEMASKRSAQKFQTSGPDWRRPIRCAAFQQMHSLAFFGLVKEPKESGEACYELLAEGRRLAHAIRAGGETKPAAPLMSNNRPRTGEATVLMLVDQRECGGSHMGPALRKFCNALIRHGARFETQMLPSAAGDYRFEHVSVSGARSNVPLIIERKGSDDIFASLKDGRWDRQQNAMAVRN